MPERRAVPMRTFIAMLAAAFISLTFVSTDASARPGGFRAGGFHGGFHGGGFRGFHGGFRHGGFRHHGFHRGFRFGAPVALGLGLGLAAGYPYYSHAAYDGCLVPRRIWTPYGWRVRWINICGYGYW